MKVLQRGGIRQFIALWLGLVVLSFGLLGGGLLYAVPRLNAKTQHLYSASRSLYDNQRFELALVAQGRDDLLWHSSGDARHQRARTQRLQEADTSLAALQSETSSPSEARLVTSIANAYARFRGLAAMKTHATPAMQTALDGLLPLVRQHRDLKDQQMEATLRAGTRLDSLIDHWTLILTLLATTLLISGSFVLWTRVFTPILKLSRAVKRFGVGDLQTRAPVVRGDEMGDLAQTFNEMAEAIAGRERERLNFVATVAHDLRNPLVVIGGAAHLLKNKEIRLAPEERIEWLSAIESNTHKLEAMIGDLMDGVQAETGQLSFAMQEVDFSVLVREITQEQAATTPTHRIHHDIAAPCLVNGDRKRLERVLMNLLSNAVKYSSSSSEVNVSLETSDTQALLRVRDEGAGIAPEDLHKLFLPFSRLERTREMASGTGLGLSSVKKIVEGHGGKITVQSTLGVGTSIEVCLPLIAKARQSGFNENALLSASSSTR